LSGWLQRPALIELWRKMIAIIPGFLRNEGPDAIPAQNNVPAQSDKTSDAEAAIQAESGRLALLGGLPDGARRQDDRVWFGLG
jgi:hypothetical protein